MRPRLNALLGMLAGGAALILVTAIIVGALASSGARRESSDANQQLTQANRQLAAATARLEAVTDQLAEIQRMDASTRADQLRARGKLNHRIDLLTRIIRKAGLPVPTEQTAGSVPPKAPGSTPSSRRPHPASPAPTGPSPRSPSVTDPCVLIPALCPFFEE